MVPRALYHWASSGFTPVFINEHSVDELDGSAIAQQPQFDHLVVFIDVPTLDQRPEARTAGQDRGRRQRCYFGFELQIHICHYAFAGSMTTSSLFSAILRISSVIFIEQYLGPHMLQKWADLNVSCGSVS